MSSAAEKKKIATTKSNHVATTPPEVSKMAPPPPPSPVLAPFPILAKSSSASNTSSKLLVGGAPVLTDESCMDAEKPGNMPSQPAGGDAQNTSVCKKVPMTCGSGSTLASGNKVARTGDSCATNVPACQSKAAQMRGVLMQGVGMATGGSDGSGDADPSGKTSTAKPAQSGDDAASGASSAPDAPGTCKGGHPVAIQSGFVVDDEIDFTLPGAIALSWRRDYSSQRYKEAGLLGRGGWVLNLEQWVRPDPARSLVEVRLDDGRSAYFEPIGGGERSFHRRERLELCCDSKGGYNVYRLYDLGTRLWREFAPQLSGGVARLTRIVDAYGNAIVLQYAGDRLSRVVDTAGRELRLTLTKQGYLSRVEVWARRPRTAEEIAERVAPEEPSLQTWVDYAYSDDGCLERATNALGYSDQYRYNLERKMVSVTLKNGHSFYYQYDEVYGRCIKTWGDGGLHTVELDFREDYEVYAYGNVEPRHYVGTEDGFTLLEETFDKTYQRKREYDDDRYLLSEANAAGEKYSYSYDERGNRLSVTDPAGNETRWVYGGDLPHKRISAEGHETSYRHDAQGALVSASYPTGESYELSYDGHGRVTSVYGQQGLAFGFSYDEHHNLSEESDSRGGRTRYQHDALGRPVRRIDTLGRVTEAQYDRLGQPLLVRFPDGTGIQASYEVLGNVASFTDALGQSTRMEYAGTGVLTKLIEPTGQVWEFLYDKIERLCRIINPRKERYEYSYDRAGRVVEERPFDGRILQYEYSKAECLSRIQYPDGSWRQLVYDPLGNVLIDKSSDGPIIFERDKQGRLLKATVDDDTGKVVTELERDGFGQIIAEVQNGLRIAYALDSKGRRVSRTLPKDAGGAVTRYAFDPIGAVTAVEHDGHRLHFERDALGRETRRAAAKGFFEQWSAYDPMDRLADQLVRRPDPISGQAHELVRRRWQYDHNGRPSSIEDSRWGTTCYQYDPLSQLIEARRGKHHEVFEYDITGSLQNILDDLGQVGRAMPWRIEQGNVLVEKNGIRYENDKSCRRTKKIEPRPDGGEDVTYYRWDCRDRLREVILPNGERLLFQYDAFARRTEKRRILPPEGDLEEQLRDALEGKGTTTGRKTVFSFLWDGDVLCAELIDQKLHRVHVHEPGTFLPLLQQENGEVYHVVNDHLGMPKELIDQSGQVAWSAAHSAFGRIVDVTASSKVQSPFRLLGQYEDEEIGLCYNRFRYFDPDAGRWCSPDSLGIVGGANLFAFNGAPTAFSDPYGTTCRRSATTGEPLYKNLLPKRLEAELADMKKAGIRPMSIDDPDFIAMVRAGGGSSKWAPGTKMPRIFKYAVDEHGNVKFVPPYANGAELKHAVIHNGRDVVAAGMASAEIQDGRVVITGLDRDSGHYKPKEGAANIAADHIRATGTRVEQKGVTEKLRDERK